jgi:hypothetical protein
MTTFGRSLVRLAALAAFLAMAPLARAESLTPGHAEGTCLDFTNGIGQIARCNGGRGQDIELPRRGTGELRVGRNCIAAGGKSEQLYTTPCRRRTEQSWYLDSSGALVNGNGLCADVAGFKKNDGARVVGFPCNGKENQRWSIADDYDDGGPYPGGPGGGGYDTALLTPRHAPGLCLDVRSGQDLIIYDCHGRSNQRFAFTTRGETELQVNGNCVTAPTKIETQLYVARCTGSYQQRWNVLSDGTIRSASGHCIDVYKGRTARETPVNLYKCNRDPNQRWDAIYR